MKLIPAEDVLRGRKPVSVRVSGVFQGAGLFEGWPFPVLAKEVFNG